MSTGDPILRQRLGARCSLRANCHCHQINFKVKPCINFFQIGYQVMIVIQKMEIIQTSLLIVDAHLHQGNSTIHAHQETLPHSNLYDTSKTMSYPSRLESTQQLMIIQLLQIRVYDLKKASLYQQSLLQMPLRQNNSTKNVPIRELDPYDKTCGF